MTWNNPTSTPAVRPITSAPRSTQPLVWGASMIWEGSDESTAAAPAQAARAPRHSRPAARPRLVHALMGVFFGLGR